MELRELRYFLAIADEESITKAAEKLYLTQPNLSRQMQKLEAEIGQPLFIRGSRRIRLTEAGILLRKRAEELLELYDKTEAELIAPISDISGDIYIGSGESYAVKFIAETIRKIQAEYPKIRFHLFSGDAIAVGERLDRGLIDFGIFIEPANLSKYECLRLPITDTWGVLMRRDSPLANRKVITPEDLWPLPLIRSKHSLGKSIISDWFHKNADELNIVATYNLIYNASLLVESGVGYALGLDKLVRLDQNSSLCFRPLSPRLESHLDIAWKKNQVFPQCAEIFMQYLRDLLDNHVENN